MVALGLTVSPAFQEKMVVLVVTGVMARMDCVDRMETKEILASRVLLAFLALAAPRETRATLVLKGLVDPQVFQAHVVKQEETASTEFKYVKLFAVFATLTCITGSKRSARLERRERRSRSSRSPGQPRTGRSRGPQGRHRVSRPSWTRRCSGRQRSSRQRRREWCSGPERVSWSCWRHRCVWAYGPPRTSRSRWKGREGRSPWPQG